MPFKDFIAKNNLRVDDACKIDHNYMTCILCAIPQWHWFPKS